MSKHVIILLILMVISAILVDAFAQTRSLDSHIAIDDPAELSREEARKIYNDLKERMATLYAMSELEEIRDYQSWEIFNDAPYISATHGQRYVNNYANARAINYSIPCRRGRPARRVCSCQGQHHGNR